MIRARVVMVRIRVTARVTVHITKNPNPPKVIDR